jgi:hypothetical protein
MTRLGHLIPEEKEFLEAEAEAWLKAFPNAKDKERLQVCLNHLKAGKEHKHGVTH